MPKKLPEKKYLLARYGGHGDALFLTPVWHEIKRRNPNAIIDVAMRDSVAPLFEQDPAITKLMPLRRMPPYNIDSVEYEHGWIALEAIKHRYDYPIDYKFSIEDNGIHKDSAGNDPLKAWLRSQNSNYQNIYDLNLAWANIDPATVPEALKRPRLYISNEERKQGRDMWNATGKFPKIAVQLGASSLTRTYYYAEELVADIRKANPEAIIAVYQPETISWIFRYSPVSHKKISIDGPDSWRKTAAIIANADICLCADTGMSHVAEALDVPSVNIYTTVPAWTRTKYYKYSRSIQPKDVNCHPCFIIHAYCPGRMAEVKKQLTDRERQILDFRDNKVPSQEVVRRLNTTQQGLFSEVQALKIRMDGFGHLRPKCIESISKAQILAVLVRELDNIWRVKVRENKSA